MFKYSIFYHLKIMSITYYITDCFFSDWIKPISEISKIHYANKPIDIPHDQNIKIIPIDTRNLDTLTNDPRVIFKTNPESIDTLDDKCSFALFMIKHFPDYIPPTIYLSKVSKDIKVEHEAIHEPSIKLIEKPAIGYSSNHIFIVDRLYKRPNTIVSQYIDHEEFYTGHMLVRNGIIIKQIYFKGSTRNVPNYIQCGMIRDYTVLEVLDVSTDIFEKIFIKLNYTGFATPNFIIKDNRIIIFEINPRPGGSLIHNKKYCTEFFEKIMEVF
jgi:hypothetical protein